MANVLNISLSDRPDRIIFNETSGVYNGATNPGGWGGPNDSVGDATAATLEVGIPNVSDTVTIDISASYPSTDSEINLAIEAEDLGLTHIVSGVWKFIYTVVSASGTFTVTKYWWFDAHAQQWLDIQLEGMDLSLLSDPMAHALKAPKNQFDNNMEYVARMFFLLRAACILASQNKVKAAQCIMNFINSQINLC